jgi:site-specific DNA-methyltransferase (adenine-specific)
LKKKNGDLASKVKNGEMKLKDAENKVKAEERKKEIEEKLSSVPIAPLYVGNFETGNLYQADVTQEEFISQLPENSVDMVITDPPWDKGALVTYAAAAHIAYRTLKSGHFLATYSGKMFLPDILDILRNAGLIYIWQFSVYQPDSNDRINKYHLYSTHRPVILMQKPGKRIDMVWMPDSVKSTRDKRYHEWGQGVELVEKLIDSYTQPGEIVLDPFIGGASVPYVAKTHTRKFIGFDISEDAIRLGIKRLNETNF